MTLTTSTARRAAAIALFATLSGTALAEAFELSGPVGVDARYFSDDKETQSSVFVEPNLYWETQDASNSFSLTLFGRWDDTDDERSAGDVREMMWLHIRDDWELHTGVGKVFWGVAESVHLVDVINQTDSVQSADGEEKLGQPMLHWSSYKDWGTVDAFLLPYFRERTFSGVDGRLGGSLLVDTDGAEYQSSDEEEHLDWALRYSHTLGDWDYGISYFKGTNRTPRLQLRNNDVGQPYLIPYYEQIEQLGLDVQATIESWLWKFEMIAQKNPVRDFAASVLGLEYTLIAIRDSSADLGLLAELHRDSRGKDSGSVTDKDLFVGARWTLNDAQDTSVLIGLNQSLDSSASQLAFIEGSRRFGDNWRGTIDARLFDSESPSDPLYQVKDDDHLSVSLEYYF